MTDARMLWQDEAPGGRRKSTKYRGLGAAISLTGHRELMTVTDSTLEGRWRRPPLREPDVQSRTASCRRRWGADSEVLPYSHKMKVA